MIARGRATSAAPSCRAPRSGSRGSRCPPAPTSPRSARRSSPRPVAVLDGADEGVADAWPAPPEGTLAVMARLKERFDPARIFRPGAYVGGL